MKKMFIMGIYLTVISFILISFQSFAQNGRECPVGLVNGMTLDEEFGPGTSEITNCIKKRNNVKLLIQISNLHPTDKDGNTLLDKPYWIGNFPLVFDTYEITHGMEIGKDVEIAVVAMGSGSLLMIDNNSDHPFKHPWQHIIENAIAKGVKFYLCQYAARNNGIKKHHMIPGVEFVPNAVVAIADFQLQGYAAVKPL